MRVTSVVVLLGLLTAGCDDPPVCDDDGAPKAKRAAAVPSGMPIEPVTLRPWGAAAPYCYQVDEATLMQALILAQGGELPLEPTGKRRRVLAAAPGSLFEQAGLRVGDEVVSLGGVAVDDDDLLPAAFRTWRRDGRLSLSILRNGEPLELDYTRDPPPAAPVVREPRPESDEVATGTKEIEVRDLGGGRFELTRESARMMFSEPSDLMRKVRILPNHRSGAVAGLRLYGIRSDSALSRLGLQNGDVVLRIGGFEVGDAEKALEAYAKLKNASEVRVDIERRSKPMTLVYQVVP